ncbi:GNAT family N-acetyltransferase [Clostridium sp. 19966]|uniref:GNAT family N-acetyltransferase n=1 Tax=Clostridium sp. 19966 TaxID=2768166 RepID=UPI0028DE655C|nr:GNAT family N-acetyltransferase [Clostridium sp. 19966]MDT8715264.1 GNAT family N-acetyltransferase [Clostridium sp. 19966]
MLDMELYFDDISISSVNNRDIDNLEIWMREQIDESFKNSWMNIDEIRERFVEYYISENEIFLKILRENKILGIFKGRAEFNPNGELVIWCYIIDRQYRNKGIGSKVLGEIIKYLYSSLGIKNCLAGVVDGSREAFNFWNKNEFMFSRVSKNFFEDGNIKKDMIILKRNEILG